MKKVLAICLICLAFTVIHIHMMHLRNNLVSHIHAHEKHFENFTTSFDSNVLSWRDVFQMEKRNLESNLSIVLDYFSSVENSLNKNIDNVFIKENRGLNVGILDTIKYDVHQYLLSEKKD